MKCTLELRILSSVMWDCWCKFTYLEDRGDKLLGKLVKFYKVTRCNISEYRNFHSHHFQRVLNLTKSSLSAFMNLVARFGLCEFMKQGSYFSLYWKNTALHSPCCLCRRWPTQKKYPCYFFTGGARFWHTYIHFHNFKRLGFDFKTPSTFKFRTGVL